MDIVLGFTGTAIHGPSLRFGVLGLAEPSQHFHRTVLGFLEHSLTPNADIRPTGCTGVLLRSV